MDLDDDDESDCEDEEEKAAVKPLLTIITESDSVDAAITEDPQISKTISRASKYLSSF